MLPEPTAASAAAVIMRALQAGDVTGHRLALTAYAKRRQGVSLESSGPDEITLGASDGRLVIGLDDRGRVAGGHAAGGSASQACWKTYRFAVFAVPAAKTTMATATAAVTTAGTTAVVLSCALMWHRTAPHMRRHIAAPVTTDSVGNAIPSKRPAAAATWEIPIIRSKSTLTPRCSALSRTALICSTFGVPMADISSANNMDVAMNAVCTTLRSLCGNQFEGQALMAVDEGS